MVSNLDLEPYLAQFSVMLGLGCALLSLRLVVEKLAIVKYPTNRRHRTWRDFYQIQTSLTRLSQRVSGGKHSETFTVVPDDEDFRRPDALVSPNFASYARTLELRRSFVIFRRPS